ncbi:MAG TPA: hypothetical protein HPQ00_09930, partial [Magnetococcales bacterium]|nr:hypothetical protein [Magnetococcales bacterium]
MSNLLLQERRGKRVGGRVGARLRKGIVAAVLAVFCLSGGPPVQTAQAESMQFAFVDVPRAMASSDAAKRARELLEKKLASKQKEVDAMEQKIKSLKDDMEKRKSLM